MGAGVLGCTTMNRSAALTLVVVVALAAFAWALNPGPRWRVAETQRADGNVLFDEDPIPASDFEAMNDFLVGGAIVEWRGFGDLELLSPGHALLVVRPGTIVRLPAPPARWFARTSRARLDEGGLRFLAGPRFRGARLLVETPARTVEIREGALAVTHDPAAGTRVESEGPALSAFARDRGALLGARPAGPPMPGDPGP